MATIDEQLKRLNDQIRAENQKRQVTPTSQPFFQLPDIGRRPDLPGGLSDILSALGQSTTSPTQKPEAPTTTPLDIARENTARRQQLRINQKSPETLAQRFIAANNAQRPQQAAQSTPVPSTRMQRAQQNANNYYNKQVPRDLQRIGLDVTGAEYANAPSITQAIGTQPAQNSIDVVRGLNTTRQSLTPGGYTGPAQFEGWDQMSPGQRLGAALDYIRAAQSTAEIGGQQTPEQQAASRNSIADVLASLLGSQNQAAALGPAQTNAAANLMAAKTGRYLAEQPEYGSAPGYDQNGLPIGNVPYLKRPGAGGISSAMEQLNQLNQGTQQTVAASLTPGEIAAIRQQAKTYVPDDEQLREAYIQQEIQRATRQKQSL